VCVQDGRRVFCVRCEIFFVVVADSCASRRGARAGSRKGLMLRIIFKNIS
jgi:hypothetical protein